MGIEIAERLRGLLSESSQRHIVNKSNQPHMKQTILLDPKEGVKEGGEGGSGGDKLRQLEDFGGMDDLGEYDILEELFERCEKADSQPLSPTPSAPERAVHSNADDDDSSAPLVTASPKKRYRRTLKEVKHPKPDVPRPRK